MSGRVVMLLLLTFVAGVQAMPSWQDEAALRDTLAVMGPLMGHRWLEKRGLEDYLFRQSWKPMPDSGLHCVGRWSYGPSLKVSLRVTADDTVICLTRGSGASLIRFRSDDSVTLDLLGDVNFAGIPRRAIITDTLVIAGIHSGGTGLEVHGVSDPARPNLLSRVDLPVVNDIAVKDTLVFAACEDDTMRIFGIADPRNPVRLGACRDSSDLAMCYADGYCYLVHSSGVNIVDVRDPANPLRAGRIAGHAPLAVQVRDSICCLTTENDGFLVYDVSDPALPEPMGTLSMPAAKDLYLPPTCDTVAYTSYFHIVSLADPAHPRLIGQVNSPGWDDGVSAVPDLSHALIADHFDGVVVVVITDPAVPVVDTMALGGGLAVNLSIAGNRLYVGSYNAGFTALDVTDPALPTRLGGLDYVGLLPTCLAVAAQDSFAYVSWEPGPQFRSVDVSDPRNPVLSGGDTLFARPEDMVLRDTFVYCAMVRRLQIVNVARPREPVLVGSCVTGDATSAGLSMRDTFAFVGNFTSQVVNVADPTMPQVVGTFNRGTWNISARDTFAFASSGGVIVYSIADPTQPRPVDSISLGPNTYWVEAVGSLLYTGNRDGVHVVDASDVHNMRDVGFCSTPYAVKRVHYASPYVYASCWDAGVCIFESTQVAVDDAAVEPGLKGIGLKVLPNPAAGRVRLTWAGPFGWAATLTVRDVLGKEVMRQSCATVTSRAVSMDVTSLASGVYYAAVAGQGRHESVKFVKR